MSIDERSKIIQGPLRKRGQKGWKERLFVLRAQDGTLGFFENNGEVTLKGKIKIRNALIQSDENTNFVVSTASGTSYILQAESQEIKEKWMAVLIRAASGVADVDELKEIWDDTKFPENETELLRQLDSNQEDETSFAELNKVEELPQNREEPEVTTPEQDEQHVDSPITPPKTEHVDPELEYFGQGELSSSKSALVPSSTNSAKDRRSPYASLCIDCFFPSCLPRPSWL
mmetsp:Transcript_18119/g.27336  ORF Transcript_18119/g.27336 Transcript_18119/m.27336 type:complete len:230 (-) Transcript_18119:104-793(-)